MHDSNFDRLRHEAQTGLRAAQQLQSMYDAVGWQIEEPAWAKLRHILLHLTKINAQIAELVEPLEHRAHAGSEIDATVLRIQLRAHANIGADLLFHAAQIANLAEADLGEEFETLHRTNARRFAPDSDFAR